MLNTVKCGNKNLTIGKYTTVYIPHGWGHKNATLERINVLNIIIDKLEIFIVFRYVPKCSQCGFGEIISLERLRMYNK